MKISILTPLFCNEIGLRSNNEDTIYPAPYMATTSDRLFLVCDGMGGHENGEIASQTVAQAISDYWRLYNHEPDGWDKLKRALDETEQKLNKVTPDNQESKMGTTLTLVSINESSVLVAHIGDSRIYQIRPNKGIVFRTKDHSMVQTWVDAGILTAEEAKVHPKKNIITKAIQSRRIDISESDVEFLTKFQDGDYLFMCTDGILEAVDDLTLVEILSSRITDEEKMDRIKELCQLNSRDNYSAYLIPLAIENAEPPLEDVVKDDVMSSLSSQDKRDLFEKDIDQKTDDILNISTEEVKEHISDQQRLKSEDSDEDSDNVIIKKTITIEKTWKVKIDNVLYDFVKLFKKNK